MSFDRNELAGAYRLHRSSVSQPDRSITLKDENPVGLEVHCWCHCQLSRYRGSEWRFWFTRMNRVDKKSLCATPIQHSSEASILEGQLVAQVGDLWLVLGHLMNRLNYRILEKSFENQVRDQTLCSISDENILPSLERFILALHPSSTVSGSHDRESLWSLCWVNTIGIEFRGIICSDRIVGSVCII